MIGVLFVCLGNICRSPMGEAIFRAEIEKLGLADQIKVDSAGTGDWHIGEMPHKGTQKVLKENRISFEGIYARQVKADDFINGMYIFTMDEKNSKDLEDFRDERTEQVLFKGRLLDFVGTSGDADIPDPYFTGNFQYVYDVLRQACQQALGKIIEVHQLK